MLVARAASRNTDRAPETELQLVVVLGWGWGGPATRARAGHGPARRAVHTRAFTYTAYMPHAVYGAF